MLNLLSTKPKKVVTRIQKLKSRRLGELIQHLAPKIIQYSRVFSLKLKKANSHQQVLFPGSLHPDLTPNPDRNENIIAEYARNSDNWYSFYFGASQTFIDNRHLQLFVRRADLPADFGSFGTGRVVCLDVRVGLTRGTRSMARHGSVSMSEVENADGQAFRDTSQQLRQIRVQQLFIAGTSQGYVIAIHPPSLAFAHLSLHSTQPISALCSYGPDLLAYVDNTARFYRIELKSASISFKQLFSVKVNSLGVTKIAFVRGIELFWLFWIDGGGLKRMALRDRKIGNVVDYETICESDKFNPFMNMKLHHQQNFNRVIITVSCTQEVLVYAFMYTENKSLLLHKLANPNNPPPIPQTHSYSCIEYFSKPSKPEVGVAAFNRKWTRYRAGRESRQNRESEGVDEDRAREWMLVAVTFTDRIYFIRIWEGSCEVSKRAKFYNRIVHLQQHKQQGIIVVMHKQVQNHEQQHLQQSRKPDEPVKIVLVTTLLRKLVSFSTCIHTEITEKIEFETQIEKSLDTRNKLQTEFGFVNGELLALGDKSIVRVGMRTWRQLYDRMRTTENIQLLNFLMLLRNYESVYLQPPECFSALQNFFPTSTPECKQLLLQYYYETQQEPPVQFISEVVHQQPSLLLPFILELRVSNLNEHTKELLTEYWKHKDERIVEELIMGGSEIGYEMAVSKGWMRALHKMVESGIEIHFPLQKLCSFVIYEQRRLDELDEVGDTDPDYEAKANQLLDKIGYYCMQMVEYTLLALEFFLAPEQLQDLTRLKQFLLVLLRPEILNNCFKYQPGQSVKIISKMFKPQQRTLLIDQLDGSEFYHVQAQFKHFSRADYMSVSLCIFSYMSQVYQELTQVKTYTLEQRTKYWELLAVEHAKVIAFSMELRERGGYTREQILHNVRGRFQFTRPYLLDMLIVLVSNNNEYVKQIIHDEFIQKEKGREERECFVQDLLVKIWLDARESPASYETQHEPSPLSEKQVRSFIGSLEQANSSNNYLCICLMLDLPAGQFCVRILRKFIYSENLLIKQRLFDWLNEAMMDDQCRESLQLELMNHLKSIIEINKQRSRLLFDKYFQNREKEIITKIYNDPLLQLQYLEMVIIDSAQSETEVEEYYLNLYLKLLVTVQPDRLIPVLQQTKIKFDMQEALKVSLEIEKYPEKNRIETFLFERLGEIERCIGSYLKILEELFWSYINCYENKLEVRKTDEPPKQKQPEDVEAAEQSANYQGRNRVTKKLSIISEAIANKNFSTNQKKIVEVEQKIERQFLSLTELIFRQPVKKYEYLKIPLDAMVSFIEQIQQQKLGFKSHYLSMLAFYFGKIIVESFEKNYLMHLNEWVNSQSKLDLGNLKRYLYEGYKRMRSQETLLENICEIDKTILVENIKQLVCNMEQSIYCESRCAICGQTFSDYKGEAILFNCGHLFHAGCIEQDENGQDYCWECIQQDQIRAMIDHTEINMVAILQRYCTKKSSNFMAEPVEVPAEQAASNTKKRMNRLGIFDKKVTTLDSQVEILDMKLEIEEYYQNINKPE